MKKISAPTLASVSPEYTELLQKRVTLRGEQTAVNDKISTVMAARLSSPQSAAREERIASIMGDEKRQQPLVKDALEFAALTQRADDIRRALEILEDRIGGARGRASRLACEKLAPDYDRTNKAIAETLAAFYEAVKANKAMRDAIDAEDISRAYLNQYGIPEKVSGHLGRLLQEAAAEGIISKSSLPKELQ